MIQKNSQQRLDQDSNRHKEEINQELSDVQAENVFLKKKGENYIAAINRDQIRLDDLRNELSGLN